MTTLLGIDIGTTGSKALLMTSDGTVLAEAATDYPTHTPRPLWSEQNPMDWWHATITSIQAVLQSSECAPSSIAAVGLTGQMHGLVPLDRHGSALRRCILWDDQRTVEQCSAITARVGFGELLKHTGNAMLPGFTAPKLLWLRAHEPEVYGRIACVQLPKDFVRYCLGGDLATDVSDASGTGLFDVEHRCWSPDMLGALDIPASWCATAVESVTVCSRVSPAAAKATGLQAGTPLVAGAGDQAAQAVGMGIVGEGPLGVTLGTSGVVFAASTRYRQEPQGRLHAFCHAVPETWHVMGVMLSAGGSLRWLRDALGQPEVRSAAETGRNTYDVLLEAASFAPPGSEGLLFLPYLSGERTPYVDPDARGVFCGLTHRHRKSHMTRAVLEGVAYGLRDCLDLAGAFAIPMEDVRVSGGGARSDLWRQILADVLGRVVSTVNVTSGAACGAALLAGVGAGAFPSVEAACARVVRVSTMTEPGPAQTTYVAHHVSYRALYHALAPFFKAHAGTPERKPQ